MATFPTNAGVALSVALAAALVVSPEGCFISFDGLSIVYPSIISSGGTVA